MIMQSLVWMKRLKLQLTSWRERHQSRAATSWIPYLTIPPLSFQFMFKYKPCQGWSRPPHWLPIALISTRRSDDRLQLPTNRRCIVMRVNRQPPPFVRWFELGISHSVMSRNFVPRARRHRRRLCSKAHLITPLMIRSWPSLVLGGHSTWFMLEHFTLGCSISVI